MCIEILPELWIGDINTLNNNLFLKNNNILCIVLCSTKLKFNKSFKTLNIRFEISDTYFEEINYIENEKIIKQLYNIIEIIHEQLTCNKSVLVVCEDGIQISPLIIMSYIIKYGKIKAEKCIELMKTKCEIHNKYYLILHQIEKNIK